MSRPHQVVPLRSRCVQTMTQPNPACIVLWIKIEGLSVFICLGCHNKIPQARWFQQLDTYFLTVWEAESPNSRVLCFLGRLFFLALRCHLLSVSSYGLSPVRTTERQLQCLLPSKRPHSNWIPAPTLWLHLTLITLLKDPSPNTVILRVRASTYKWVKGVDKSVHNTAHLPTLSLLSLIVFNEPWLNVMGDNILCCLSIPKAWHCAQSRKHIKEMLIERNGMKWNLFLHHGSSCRWISHQSPGVFFPPKWSKDLQFLPP